MKTKHPHNPRKARFQRAASPVSRARWSRWLLFAAILGATAGGLWAVLEFVVWVKVPSALVGKWVVQGGEQEGATFDFYRTGTMVGRVNAGGREGVINARVCVDGDKLYSTTTNPHTRQDETGLQVIRTLTEWELVLEDDHGQVLRFTRAH